MKNNCNVKLNTFILCPVTNLQVLYTDNKILTDTMKNDNPCRCRIVYRATQQSNAKRVFGKSQNRNNDQSFI